MNVTLDVAANYKFVGYDFTMNLPAAADRHACTGYLAVDATVELNVACSCDGALDHDVGSDDRRYRGRARTTGGLRGGGRGGHGKGFLTQRRISGGSRPIRLDCVSPVLPQIAADPAL